MHGTSAIEPSMPIPTKTQVLIEDEQSSTARSITTIDRPFRMVALDLDGTLLSDDHRIAEEQAEYLRTLHQRGFIICLATGRSAPSVYEHIRKLNFPQPIPVVCSNGACGFEMTVSSSSSSPGEQQHHQLQRQQSKELFVHPVSLKTVQATLRLANDHGFAVQFYHQDLILVNSNTPEHAAIVGLYSQLTGSTITYVEDDFDSMLVDGKLPSKLLVLFPESRIDHATHVYQNGLTADQATIVGGAFDWFLEVLDPHVHKGYGLARMCEYLEIPISQCIAMGDGANDLEFLQMAGLGIAMKNARDIVKQHADMALEWTNAEHGVMRALERLDRDGKLTFES